MAPSVGAPSRRRRTYAGDVEHRGAAEAGEQGEVFRLGFVPGVTPAKWAQVFRSRHRDVSLLLVPVAAGDAELAVVGGELDAAILRPPVDRAVLHAIPLYAEDPVVVVPRDHLLAALDESEPVDPADLADEVLLQPADDVLRWANTPGADDDAIAPPGRPAPQVPASTSDAIELVAAGLGVVVVPRSLARLHQRKDVTVRTLADGPTAPVVLAWSIEREDERTEDLIGIVRGRTVNSSRGGPSPAQGAPTGVPPSRRAQPDPPGRGRRRSPRKGRRRR